MKKEELRAIRKSLHQTQREFAQNLGLVRETVCDMENGHRPIRRTTALAVKQLKTEQIIEQVRVMLAL